MAVPSAADFYSQWVGGTGLQKQLEAAAKKETSKKYQSTWVQNALKYYQRAALEGANLGFAYNPRLGLPSFSDYTQQFSSAYKGLVTAEGAKQEQELQAQQAQAEQAAKELAAEQARIQAQLQAEQQAILQQQQQQAAAIEAQLVKERQTAEAEQSQLRAQFETERQQTERLIGEAQAETERQQIVAKRESAITLNVGKQASLEELRKQQAAAAPVRLPQEQRKRTMIGQPGVSATRFSARSGVGGYGGTAAGRINPTGLNI
jgi:hypothetical protein